MRPQCPCRAVPRPAARCSACFRSGKRDEGGGLFDGAGGFFFCGGRCFYLAARPSAAAAAASGGSPGGAAGGGRRWPRCRGFLHGLRPKSPAAAAAVVLMPPAAPSGSSPPAVAAVAAFEMAEQPKSSGRRKKPPVPKSPPPSPRFFALPFARLRAVASGRVPSRPVPWCLRAQPPFFFGSLAPAAARCPLPSSPPGLRPMWGAGGSWLSI